MVDEELSAFAAARAAAVAVALAILSDVEEALRDASAVLATCAAMLASGLAAADAWVVASACAAATAAGFELPSAAAEADAFWLTEAFAVEVVLASVVAEGLGLAAADAFDVAVEFVDELAVDVEDTLPSTAGLLDAVDVVVPVEVVAAEESVDAEEFVVADAAAGVSWISTLRRWLSCATLVKATAPMPEPRDSMTTLNRSSLTVPVAVTTPLFVSLRAALTVLGVTVRSPEVDDSATPGVVRVYLAEENTFPKPRTKDAPPSSVKTILGFVTGLAKRMMTSPRLQGALLAHGKPSSTPMMPSDSSPLSVVRTPTSPPPDSTRTPLPLLGVSVVMVTPVEPTEADCTASAPVFPVQPVARAAEAGSAPGSESAAAVTTAAPTSATRPARRKLDPGVASEVVSAAPFRRPCWRVLDFIRDAPYVSCVLYLTTSGRPQAPVGNRLQKAKLPDINISRYTLWLMTTTAPTRPNATRGLRSYYDDAPLRDPWHQWLPGSHRGG